MIPTLLFGVPGGGVTAVLLGGLLILGIEVGPRMVTENIHITFSIVWTLVLANVMGTGVCLLLAHWVSRLSFVSPRVFFPFLIVCIVLAAYQNSRHWGDLIAFGALGILGLAMKQLDWPRPPLLLGFILSANLERYLNISIGRYNTEWLLFPSVVVIAMLIAGVLIAAGKTSGSSAYADRAGAPALNMEPPAGSRGQIMFAALALALMTYAAVVSVGWTGMAGTYPLLVSAVGAALVSAHVLGLLRNRVRVLPAMDSKSVASGPTRAMTRSPPLRGGVAPSGYYGLWVGGLLGAIWLVGFPAAAGIFVTAFLKVEARTSWSFALVASAVILGALAILSELMTLYWPRALIALA